MIDLHEALRIIAQHRGNAVVVPTMMGGRHWGEITQNESLDLPITGAMGKASSMGLGIALAQPDRKVIVVDGDGSLVMNLGSLVTIANKAPKNLVHFVVQNGVYAITGGQPVPGTGLFSLAGLAREAGYPAVYEFDNLEDFATSAAQILTQDGPVFVCLKVEPEIETRPIGQRPPFRRTVEAFPVLWKALRQ